MEKKNFETTLAKKPTINHTKKAIIVSDKFLHEAANPFSNEAADIMLLREKFPGYEITTRSHRKPRTTEKTQNIKKFVPYDKMEKYISLLDNSDELLRQYQIVKDFAACRRNSASIVFKWFNESFPDYRKDPKIDENGKLVAKVNVVRIEDLKKKAELPQAAVPQYTDELEGVV